MADGVNDKNNTVAIKVPPFFKHAPETWFAHLEAQFDIKKLTTSSTKFYYCISALPSDVSAHLTHMIRDPGDDPYQEIKDRLIHLYNLSNYQKFEALINLPFTSDTPPSVLMSSMLNLYPRSSNQILSSLVYSSAVCPSLFVTISLPWIWTRTPIS